MKDAELVALAEAQWIRSYVRLLVGSGMILGAPLLYLSFELLINWHRWACKLSSTKKKNK